jgi:hypothetical protein
MRYSEPLVAGPPCCPGGVSDLMIQVTLVHGYGPAHAHAQAAIQRAAERIVALAGRPDAARDHGDRQPGRPARGRLQRRRAAYRRKRPHRRPAGRGRRTPSAGGP